MPEKVRELENRVSELEKELAFHRGVVAGRGASGIRRRSHIYVYGIPLYDIAFGPSLATGEPRGHAKGIFALGDIATGVLAVGGVARGIIAIGGVAIGIFSLGGMAIGLAMAVGGAVLGSVVFGGLACGLVAIGGCAVGYYALGGVALGVHTVASWAQDPQAIQFFNDWLPGFRNLWQQLQGAPALPQNPPAGK